MVGMVGIVSVNGWWLGSKRLGGWMGWSGKKIKNLVGG